MDEPEQDKSDYGHPMDEPEQDKSDYEYPLPAFCMTATEELQSRLERGWEIDDNLREQVAEEQGL